MNRSTASQASKKDARPNSDRWPRVGARIENGSVIVRVLDEGEEPSKPVKRAVLIAEPCEQFPTLAQAIKQTAARIANRLRQQAPGVAVEVRI
jgi:hypothetical protein